MPGNNRWNHLPHLLMNFIKPEEAVRRIQVPFEEKGRQELINNGELEAIAKLIYDRLIAEKINYAEERFTLDEDFQIVSSPTEIVSLKEGNCLDLSLLYCSLCHFYGLMTSVVVFSGHAIACVNVKEALKEHSGRNVAALVQENEGVIRGKTMDAYNKFSLFYLNSGHYIFIDCTGFSKYNSFSEDVPEGKNRTSSGLLDFESSKIAGKDQFSKSKRRFKYLVDLFHCIELRKIREQKGGNETPVQEDSDKPNKEELAEKMDTILEILYNRNFDRYEKKILDYLKEIKSDNNDFVLVVKKFKAELRILGGQIKRIEKDHMLGTVTPDTYRVSINNYMKALDNEHEELKEDLLGIEF